PAVREMVAQVIRAAKAAGRKIGICGQAPSDCPEFAQFLVAEGIDSISLNPDSVLKTMEALAKMWAAGPQDVAAPAGPGRARPSHESGAAVGPESPGPRVLRYTVPSHTGPRSAPCARSDD